MNEISSLQHPLVKHLVKIRQNSSYRYDHQSIVIEGKKPVLEACQRTKAKIILTCHPNLLTKNLSADKIYLVTEQVMQKISGMVNSEGLLAEMQMPAYACLKNMRSILVLDHINDPGNLGTLLRTALALGWEGAFLIGEGCDPYNEKALRASRGACLHLPWRRGDWHEIRALCQKNHLLPLLADLEGKPPSPVEPGQGVLLILSNEARGPSKEALDWCSKVTIPISSKMESLNVAIAGGILMYSLLPQNFNR